MVEIVTRREWGARQPRDPLTPLPSARGVKIHYVGSYVNPALVDNCDRCFQLVRSIQIQHQDNNDWDDIAYNVLVCPHRKMFIGRGPGMLSAANGKGLNTGHYAINALLGSRGLVQPTAGMLLGIRDAITYLREHGAGKEIRGHRDGYATSCPGDILYGWVERGCPAPAVVGGNPKPPAKPATPGKGNPGPAWPGRVLSYTPGRPLMQGGDVETWQKLMRAHKFTIAVDGQFGPMTRATTVVFQRSEGLDQDGLVGRLTWAAATRG
ncbi:N-acetylmuramoyl-L-alanine amidase [Streptosporangium sp. NPDC002524]|uniref:peptidoglycan recognition protein family protein n=1 Tax=Streptosporangium sp. NPDC002524 TaxID=3154537 RepID=UPI00331E19F0